MNLDEIKAKALNEVIQKEISQDSFDDKKTILKLCAALELAIKQRDDALWSRHKNDEKYSRLVFTNLVSEAMDKEIEELLK